MGKRPAGYWIVVALLAASVAYNIWVMGRTIYNFPTSYFVGETYFGLKLIAIALLLRTRAEGVYFLIGAFVIGLLTASTIYWELGVWNALRRYEGLGWLSEVIILLVARFNQFELILILCFALPATTALGWPSCRRERFR
jgi:hypothetical protein